MTEEKKHNIPITYKTPAIDRMRYENKLLRQWIRSIAPEKYEEIMGDVKNDIKKEFNSGGDRD